MVLPGWNVSEPIDLAFKLYEVVESLRNAPESAKAFVSKIRSFGSNLDKLQKILEDDAARHPGQPTQDLEHLQSTILECKTCVKRCEEYSQKFKKLTSDGKGKMDGAGQAALWALQKQKVASLIEEIDGQMNSIGLTIAIQTLADGRTRQGSHSASSRLTPPPRSGTVASLPPYSSPRPNWTQANSLPQAKTPAELLGIEYQRKTSDSDIFHFELNSEGKVDKGMTASPTISPNTLRPTLTEQDEVSELDSEETLKPLHHRRNTTSEVAVSPTRLEDFSAWSEGSSAASRVFTSPTISSRRTSATEVTISPSTLESAVMEMAMKNLVGVQVAYHKENSRLKYPVSSIESFRDKQTGHRYIVISPPASSKIEFYLAPPIERVIAHSEHPQAYGSTTTHRVKFIEAYPLRSQRISSKRKASDASSVLSPSLAPESSAASVASSRSLGSPVFATNFGGLKIESRTQEYDFKDKEDYWRFQELLMGPDAKLQLQEPVQSITVKKYEESKSKKQTELQFLRLWQSDGRQTLMFFANLLEPNKYREYPMENFRPVESKSKTTIRLDVHLPGMVRRRSSSKSPLLIPKSSAQEKARFGGYPDENGMANLDYLSIEFGSAEGMSAFLRKAKFHASAEEPIASSFTVGSRYSMG